MINVLLGKYCAHKRTFINYRFSDDPNRDTFRESLSAFTLKQLEKNIGTNVIISDYRGIKTRDESYFGQKIDDYFPIKAYIQARDTATLKPAKKNNKLLWISRFSEHKRVSLLPKLANSMRLSTPDVHVDLYAPSIKPHEAAAISKRNKKFVFKGVASSFSELDTDHYDALIYTSHLDGIPNVLIESMSSGLPAIAPVIGGIPELISDGENGFLVHSDKDDLIMCASYIDAIRRLYNLSDTERLTLRLNAIDFITKNHSEESHRKAIHEIFDSRE